MATESCKLVQPNGHNNKSAEVSDRYYGTHPNDSNDGNNVEDASERLHIENQSTQEAVLSFLSSSFVNTITYGIWNTLDLIVLLAMAAYLPDGDAFAGVGTAMTLTSLTALSISNGMSSALETLISNAYGANRYSTAISKYLMAGTAVSVVMFLPMAIFFLAVPQSWLEVVFPNSNSEMMGAMILWLRLSPLIVLPQLFSFNLQKFAVFQRKPEIVTYSAAASIVLLPLLLIYASHKGTVGAFAFAIAADKFALFGMLVANILYDDALRANLWGHGNTHLRSSDDETEIKEVVTPSAADEGVSSELPVPTSLMGYVVQYLWVGSPSAVAYCIDTWTFELMIIIAARCGPTEAAAWVMMQQMTYPLFAAANGLSSAAAADAGHAYGAGCRPSTILKRVRIVAMAAFLVGMVCGSATYLFGPRVFPVLIQNSHESKAATVTTHEGSGHHAGSIAGSEGSVLFSTSEAVATGLDSMTIYAFHILVDVPFFAIQGTYRGLNKQTVAAELVFVAMWCMAVPVAVFWPLITSWIPHIGSSGCVHGIATALFVGSGVGAVLLYVHIERSIQQKIADRYIRYDDGDSPTTADGRAGNSISFAAPDMDRIADPATLTRL